MKTAAWNVVRLLLVAALLPATSVIAADDTKPVAKESKPFDVERILAQEVAVPKGVAYKQGSREANEAALQKIAKSLLHGDPKQVPAGVFNDALICGAGMWKEIKDDDAVKKLNQGRVKIKVPTDAGVQELEGKLFQSKSDVAIFWDTFRRKYEFNDEAIVRRPTSAELELYWAMIPYDIDEPIFMIETKAATLLAHFGSDGRIGWIDDFKTMSLKKTPAAALNQIRLYIPTPELPKRFGDDIEPLTKYIKVIEKRLDEILATEPKPTAKGLFVAIGFKSKTKTRFWCEAVEGDVPAELLLRLEKELAEVEAVDLKQGPAALALEVNLFGAKAEKFPKFPQPWLEAVKKHDIKIITPPDELFQAIWPD